MNSYHPGVIKQSTCSDHVAFNMLLRDFVKQFHGYHLACLSPFILNNVLRDLLKAYDAYFYKPGDFRVHWPTQSVRCYGDQILLKRLIRFLLNEMSSIMCIAKRGQLTIEVDLHDHQCAINFSLVQSPSSACRTKKMEGTITKSPKLLQARFQAANYVIYCAAPGIENFKAQLMVPLNRKLSTINFSRPCAENDGVDESYYTFQQPALCT